MLNILAVGFFQFIPTDIVNHTWFIYELLLRFLIVCYLIYLYRITLFKGEG